jgi:RND family efflux transporter MFP subunit
MYAYFDVDERTYLELTGGSSSEQGAWFNTLQYPVLMRLANEDNFSRSGTINFLDNRVNANTGTVRMRGVFENPSGALKSGLFVRIRLPIGAPYRPFLIPDEAILSDQGRKYVYVLDDENKVVYRPVKIGQEVQALRVVKEGILNGDRVIVSGMQRVRRGATVQATTQPPPKPPESPLSRVLSAWKADNESRKHADKETRKPSGASRAAD